MRERIGRGELLFRRERRTRRVAQKQSVYSRVQGTNWWVSDESTYETAAAVVRWEIGGGRFWGFIPSRSQASSN